ncbi:MAG: ATP-binding protein [Archangium sp.]|nr:ATP-binding protein [Archangium sp.]
MTREELEALREGWGFEAKLAAGRNGRGEVPDSFWESYSALANTDGGVIVLGARELDDGRLEFAGLGDPERVETDLWNGLQNPQKVSVNLLRREDVERVVSGGLTALVLRVPKALRAQRPVFIKGSWERGTYLRVHEGDRLADRELARRMLADAQPDHDARIVEGVSLQDLHEESVRRYRQLFTSKRPDHPFATEDDQGFLRQLGVLVRDRVGGREGISQGGLLMLGRELAIRDLFPHWHLSYREESERPTGEQRWVDRVADDGTWNANLFEFYLRVIGKLHAGLKVPFALEGAQFRMDETPAHAAVREALVNTLVHADYAGRGGIRVIRSPASFEFVNPGLLLISTSQLWAGGLSEPRNPVLQRLFAHLQLGEREGSGGPAIRQAWSTEHWRAPELRQDAEHLETHLVLRQESLLPETSVAALKTAMGSGFDQLEPLDRVALVTAHAEGAISHSRLTELTGEHPRTVTLRIQELVRRGVLSPTARPRTDGYRLSVGGPADSTEVAANSMEAPPSSPEVEPSSLEVLDGPETTRDYTPRAEMLEAVLSFCSGGWRRIDEIAVAVGRKASTVRNEYVRPLVNQSRLEVLHPTNPRHPQQAYRTKAPV